MNEISKFDLNNIYRLQLDSLGYKGVSLWNILIDLKNKSLGEEVLKNVEKLESEIREFQQKHGNIGVYQREFKILNDLKTNLDLFKKAHFDNELLRPINLALNDLYYSNSVEIQNECMRVAIDFIKNNKIEVRE